MNTPRALLTGNTRDAITRISISAFLTAAAALGTGTLMTLAAPQGYARTISVYPDPRYPGDWIYDGFADSHSCRAAAEAHYRPGVWVCTADSFGGPWRLHVPHRFD